MLFFRPEVNIAIEECNSDSFNSESYLVGCMDALKKRYKQVAYRNKVSLGSYDTASMYNSMKTDATAYRH